MCGRYALWGIDLLGQRFLVIDPMLGFRSKFNIAPATKNPAIVHSAEGCQAVPMQWGLVPADSRDPRSTVKAINARAETLAELPMFRKLLAANRCIVPANGFYEWKKAGRDRVPYFFHIRDKALFGFAGLWETRKDAAGKPVTGYTIVTTKPNETVARVHDRMPVILYRENEEAWLSGQTLDPVELRRTLEPYPAEEMFVYRVSAKVGSASAEGEELIRPVGEGKGWW